MKTIVSKTCAILCCTSSITKKLITSELKRHQKSEKRMKGMCLEYPLTSGIKKTRNKKMKANLLLK